MLLDTTWFLLLATGAVLAVIGYLLNDVGATREAALGALVERETAHAFLDPVPPALGRAGGRAAWPALAFMPEVHAPYPYRELPEPTPFSTDIPVWLRRALERTDVVHTLDRDDQLVLFIRVLPEVPLLDCTVQWFCRALPDARGVLLRLSFRVGRRQYDRTFALRFTSEPELRHAVGLARQEVLRIDFLARQGPAQWRHEGSRVVALPPGVSRQLRQVLMQFGEERGGA